MAYLALTGRKDKEQLADIIIYNNSSLPVGKSIKIISIWDIFEKDENINNYTSFNTKSTFVKNNNIDFNVLNTIYTSTKNKSKRENMYQTYQKMREKIIIYVHVSKLRNALY